MTSLLSDRADLFEEPDRGKGAARRVERERSGFRARLTDHLAVAVGTTQGLFIVSDGMPDGPFFKGNYVPAFLQVGRRYLVATIDPTIGPTLQASDDGGTTWSDPAHIPIVFPADTGEQLVQICQLQLDRSATSSKHCQADVILAGVEPAGLFRSGDGGVTFEFVRGLHDHPDRPSWKAGPSGLVLHTILTHPDRPGRILVAIANGGVYRSDDGGATWQARNVGIAARGLDAYPDHGQRVSKMAFDAVGPDALWAQTDTGTYRSSDAGDSWQQVGRAGEAGGVASDFGFPVVGHPVEAGTAFVFPLESDIYPCSPGGHCLVYRTIDGGAHWDALSDGLPREHAHVTVLGDAFTVGVSAPFPLAFGTKTGQIFASGDNGASWRQVVSELPPVLCLRVLE